MKKSVILQVLVLFLTSCTQNPPNYPITSDKKSIVETHLVSEYQPIAEQSSTIESEEIHDSDLPQSNTPSSDEKPQHKDDLSQSTVVETKDNSTTAVEDTPQKPSPASNPSTTPENTSPPVKPPKPEAPPVPQPTLACPNALYDANQPCDWIHPNLRPVDEHGSSVPLFTTSQEAWNWGDAQMMDQSSKWYMCGYNRMDGHINDGTPFYYAYMKSCSTE